MHRRGKRSWPGPRPGAPLRWFFTGGFRRRGRLQMSLRAHSCPPLWPPDSHYGGRTPAGFYGTSDAQNLSGWSKFLPAHWGLAFPKLKSARFHNCAWLGRAGGDWCWAVGRDDLGAPRTSAGRSGTGPYNKKGPLSDLTQGQVCDPPVPSPWDISPCQGADSPYQGEMAEGQKG